jgi:glycosyltransferase involved in cell wall biosynthesis
MTAQPTPKDKIDFILLYGSLRDGGIETLIMRTSTFFINQGYNVAICCKDIGHFADSLDGRISIIQYRNIYELHSLLKSHFKMRRGEHKLIVISFDPISAARALYIQYKMQTNFSCTHLSGIFHPRAYFMSNERPWGIFLNYLVARAIGKRNLFFMNIESRNSHENQWNLELSNSPVIPLPILYSDSLWTNSHCSNIKIVSVGRLVDFKTYNLAIPQISRSCRDHGVNAIWDIFGEGPLFERMIAEIEGYNIKDRVFLKGHLKYTEFSETVSKYDIFVGMGTAALEAAMTGMPTICTTIDHPYDCYGYISDLPFGNVGELQEIPPTTPILDLIKQFSESNDALRNRLSQNCKIAAEKYSMQEFLKSILQLANRAVGNERKIVRYLISQIYYVATESPAAALVRRYLLDPVKF